MRLFARIAALTIAAVGLVAVPAGAGEYPPAGCQLAVDDSTVTPNQVVIVSTTACEAPYAPVVEVGLDFLSDPVFLGNVTTDAGGQFSTPVTIPGDATEGPHTIRSTGPAAAGGTLVLEVGVTVAIPGDGGGGQLAFTGSNSFPFLAVALIALAIGTALVLGARRRAEARASLRPR